MDKIIICDTSKVLSSVISFDNIAFDYETLCHSADNQSFWNKFNNIIYYECNTFLAIMNMLNSDVKIDTDNVIIHDIGHILDNYIIKSLRSENIDELRELLIPMGEYFKTTYKNYLDVFSRDKDNMMNINIPDGDELYRIVVLFSNNKYIGHIYDCTCNLNNTDEVLFVGIRESLMNRINKIYNLPSSSNVGLKLLDASRRYTITYLPHIKTIGIFNPIGPMRYITSKYGFIQEYDEDDGFEETSNMIMNIKSNPKIDINDCEIIKL